MMLRAVALDASDSRSKVLRLLIKVKAAPTLKGAPTLKAVPKPKVDKIQSNPLSTPY
jgi:hypothetical protein